jgi:hypothetical protein
MERAGNLDPLAILPIAPVLRHFAQIDFRIEVRRERFAMVAGIAVDNVDIFDLVEQAFLLGIGAIDVGAARIEAATENGGQARFLEAVLIGPLPVILEFCDVPRLIIRRVHIMGLGGETGVHDRQVLVRQRHVDHQVRLHLFDQGNRLRRHCRHRLERSRSASCTGLRDFFARDQPPRCQRDMLERFAVHRAFLGDNRTGGAGTDDENAVHDGRASKTLRGS